MKKLIRLTLACAITALPLSSAYIHSKPAHAEQTIEIRQWSSLSTQEKNDLRLEAYILFPEILQFKKHGKFFALNEWMAEEKLIIHPNVRDIFRLKEGKIIKWNEGNFELPGIYATLISDAPSIQERFTTRAKLEIWLTAVNQFADYETETGIRVSEIIQDASNLSNFPLDCYNRIITISAMSHKQYTL